MEEEKIVQFKEACRNYFQKVSLNALRSYGRFIGLQKPTTQKKQEVIEDIIKMLCGEIKPDRNGQGAPVKESVNMDFVKMVEQLKAELIYFLVLGLHCICQIKVVHVQHVDQ